MDSTASKFMKKATPPSRHELNQKKLDGLKKIYTKSYLNFPSNLGMSGQVFNMNEKDSKGMTFSWTNTAEKTQGFVGEIDN